MDDELIARIKYVFVEAWRLYTGLDYFDDLPRISGRFYIHKPKIFERKNTRTKKIGYIEIVAELPQAKPTLRPEYIVVITYRSWHDWFRPTDYRRMLGYIHSRLKHITYRFSGQNRFFIYIVCNKYTHGVMEQHRRVFARLSDNYVFRIILSHEDSPIKDIANYIHKRVERLLDPKLYYKSNYEVFGRPKRLAEYLLILEALLNKRNDIAREIAYLLHHTARLQVNKLLDIQAKIYNTINEEPSGKKQQAKPLTTLYI